MPYIQVRRLHAVFFHDHDGGIARVGVNVGIRFVSLFPRRVFVARGPISVVGVVADAEPADRVAAHTLGEVYDALIVEHRSNGHVFGNRKGIRRRCGYLFSVDQPADKLLSVGYRRGNGAAFARFVFAAARSRRRPCVQEVVYLVCVGFEHAARRKTCRKHKGERHYKYSARFAHAVITFLIHYCSPPVIFSTAASSAETLPL